MAAFLVTFGFVEVARTPDWRLLLGLTAIVLTAVVGWKDDHAGLSVWPRLAAHVAAGIMMLPLAVAAEPAFGWAVAFIAIWWVFWTVSAINVVNFMDGIDGIIGLQALVFALHLVLLGGDDALARPYGLALAGAAIGFLLWNWAPARIFMGDVGSGALGAAMVLGGLLLMRDGGVGLAAGFLPLYPIFLDAAVTLIRRALRGERLTVAHRTHLYQKLANGGWGHARVSALYGGVSLLGSALVVGLPGVRGVIMAGYFVSVAVLGYVLERMTTPRPRGTTSCGHSQLLDAP